LVSVLRGRGEEFSNEIQKKYTEWLTDNQADSLWVVVHAALAVTVHTVTEAQNGHGLVRDLRGESTTKVF